MLMWNSVFRSLIQGFLLMSILSFQTVRQVKEDFETEDDVALSDMAVSGAKILLVSSFPIITFVVLRKISGKLH